MIPKRREGEIQAGILAYLAIRGDLFFWRANVAQVRPRPGAPPVRFGIPGQADILCCQARPTYLLTRTGLQYEESLIGRMVGVEVKRVGEGPDPDQIAWGAQLTAAGGLYIVAHSIDEVRAGLGEPQVRIQRPHSGRAYPK
jgi:hypothetical protein